MSASAHNPELRNWLRAEGRSFGSVVRDWAHKKGLDDADLAEEGVDLDESTDATPAPVPAPEVETETAKVETGTATIDRGGNRGNGKAGAEGNGGHGNGGQGNGGQGNGNGNSGKGNGRN